MDTTFRHVGEPWNALVTSILIARARALLALAALALVDGDARRCAILLAAAAGIRSGIELALTAPEIARHNALAAAARDALGPAAYTAAGEHGATMPTRHAVAYALSRT